MRPPRVFPLETRLSLLFSCPSFSAELSLSLPAGLSVLVVSLAFLSFPGALERLVERETKEEKRKRRRPSSNKLFNPAEKRQLFTGSKSVPIGPRLGDISALFSYFGFSIPRRRKENSKKKNACTVSFPARKPSTNFRAWAFSPL